MALQATRTVGAREADPELQRQQYLTFVLGRETMAIGILGIREIIEYSVPTDVPMVPRHIRGVINLRGAVVPVVDLAARFGRESAPVSKRTCIVIIDLDVNGDSQILGVVVDAVTEVIDIPESEIEPAPSFGGSIRCEFIDGLGKVDGQFVVILNPERTFSVDDLGSLASAGAGVA